jgi:acetate---CoA ligase (ADP-forming) subunit beta
MSDIIIEAVERGQGALSEYDSKRVVESKGVIVSGNRLATSRDEAVQMAQKSGYPVALKGCSPVLTHKTEMGMVKLKLKTPDEVANAYDDITSKGVELDGVIVQEWVEGDNREFVIGMTRDPQFGPCVMFGLGGIFTEALKDVSFRVAPLTEVDAMEMIDEIRTQKLLGEFRGSPPVDKKKLVDAIVGMGNLACEFDRVAEIDINPLVIEKGEPVAVDALIILKK